MKGGGQGDPSLIFQMPLVELNSMNVTMISETQGIAASPAAISTVD